MKTLIQTVRESTGSVGGAPLVLYGASVFCGRIVRAFVSAGVHPSCICDGDVIKQGENYYGLDVISPAVAIAKYPNAKFFITSFFHAPEIIGILTNDMGVLPTQILNYEKVEWRKSCPHLETEAHLIADASTVNLCCPDFDTPMIPSVEICGDNSEWAIQFTHYRDMLISELQRGISDSVCRYCRKFQEGYYYVKHKVRRIMHSEGGGCNFRCIYCNSSVKHPVNLMRPDLISFPNFLFALDRHGDLPDDPRLVMGAGEFTIHPERSQLYELCDHAEHILTNGSIYDENLSKIIANGNSALNISIDAGTRQTYKKVKGIDCFDKVIENIRQYTDNINSSVHLKFIFLPGVNDNLEDVEGFVDICSSSRIEYALISYDFNSNLNEISEHTLRMIKLMTQRFENQSLLYADIFGLTKMERFSAMTI